MNCQELQDHYELYALGLAEDPERSEIRAHLNRKCEVCMPGVKRALEATALLGTTVSDAAPSGKLRDRILASVGAEPRRFSLTPFFALVTAMSIGVTVYVVIDSPNKRVEIGGTYYRPDCRGGVVNPEAKFLMLRYAFESGVRCVQLRVDAANARSRAAVSKLGAHQDGILRQDRITWTGRTRDTVIFSILAEEWPEVREKLLQRIGA